MMRVSAAEPAPPPPFLTTAADVRLSDAFYEEEGHGSERFRWMGERAALGFDPADEPRFLELWVLSEFRDLSQVLTVRAGGQTQSYPLVGGWAPLSVTVPGGADAVELAVNKLFPREYYPGDSRRLSVRVRDVRLHQDQERHATVARQYENLRLNQQELLTGATTLESTPPSLGIDLHGACNVKPPCVYCEWDFNKALEGERADVPFTRETLREWGAFFDNSVTLINCSIGEPFMMRNLDELLDIFSRTGKTLEMTTNGQILTDRNIQKLLGVPIDLYVSLDAATPATYAKLRNNTFERLLGNLRRLIVAKGGRGAPPYVHLVFMPMRCNLHELEDFVRLVRDLDADRLVLRPLNYTEGANLDWERAGYHFEYKNELLPFDEVVGASRRAARLARELGVELADQMDFGGSMQELFRERGDEPPPPAELSTDVPAPQAHGAEPATPPHPESEQQSNPSPPLGGVTASEDSPAAVPGLPPLGGERTPACLEPWKSLYILRRGVLPCCYGGEPIAPMEEYRSAWNSPIVQSIRSELLHGRFHDYCLRSPACPIVRKSQEAKLLPRRQRSLMYARHAWRQFNRATQDLPNRFLYTPIKRTLIRVHRMFTQPGYVAKHSRRLLNRTRGRQ